MQFKTTVWYAASKEELELATESPGQELQLETGAHFIKTKGYFAGQLASGENVVRARDHPFAKSEGFMIHTAIRLVGASDEEWFGNVGEIVAHHCAGIKEGETKPFLFKCTPFEPLEGWPEVQTPEPKAKPLAFADELVKRLTENPDASPIEVAQQLKAEFADAAKKKAEERKAKQAAKKAAAPAKADAAEKPERELTEAEKESARVQAKYAKAKAKREAKEQKIADQIGGGWEAEITSAVEAE